MKLRQSRDREILSQIRRVKVGEVDHQIDLCQLEVAPRATFDSTTVATCNFIYQRYVQPGDGSLIPRHLFHDVPIWLFLEYATTCGVLLHGSTDSCREELIPERLSQNLIGWDLPRHFAFRSSAEAMFGAVLDKQLLKRLDCPQKSSAAMVESDGVTWRKRFYYGIDYRALPHGPWTNGTVYLYRSADFPDDFEVSPFLSAKPIRPLARINVAPQDWPLLGKVSGVDIVALSLKTRESYAGFPWRRDDQVHPHLKHESQVAEMADCLKTNLDRPIDLSHLGSLVDASPVAAMRMFRAQKGVTPHKYHLRLRVDKAKELLKRSLPVAYVAAECGFADQSHLTRQFGEDLGLTPGQYLRAQESSIRER